MVAHTGRKSRTSTEPFEKVIIFIWKSLLKNAKNCRLQVDYAVEWQLRAKSAIETWSVEKQKLNLRCGANPDALNWIALRLDSISTLFLFQNIIITMSRFGDRDRGFGGGRDRDRDRDGGSRFGGGGRFGGGFGGKWNFLVFYRCCFGFATVSKLHSLSRRGQLEGQAARRQPEGRQLGQGPTGALREELLQRHQGEPERGPPRCGEVQVGKSAIYCSVHI